MISNKNGPGSNLSEPVRTPENPLEYKWLTVDEAVAFCAAKGLTRTPKTLRKWAERPFNKPDAEILVWREDTMWAYRWKIEEASLARKVEQELELARANATEPVRTSSNKVSADLEAETAVIQGEPDANASEPDRTGWNEFPQVETKLGEENRNEPGAHPSEHVRTSSMDNRAEQPQAPIEEILRERLRDKNTEIEFLRKQLEKAQAEVGRRATSTDEALKTIDRVVHSFEMQAEANKALALREAGTSSSSPQAPEPIRFTPESVTHTPETPYQQVDPDWSRV